MNKIDCFETDFVYSDIKTEELKNVHIKLNVENDNEFLLDIFSEEPLLKNELEEILNQLNTTFFKKVRISITNECKIIARTIEDKSLIKVADSGIVVKKIIPVMEGE